MGGRILGVGIAVLALASLATSIVLLAWAAGIGPY